MKTPDSTPTAATRRVMRWAWALTTLATLFTLSNVTGYGWSTSDTQRLLLWRVVLGVLLWGVAALAWGRLLGRRR